MNVRHDDSRYDIQAETRTVTGDRRPSVGSLASTAGASSYGSITHEENHPLSPHLSSGLQGLNMSATDRPAGAPPTSPTTSAANLSSGQSIIDARSASTRRREKAAVGFACLNCKKAHLACDVSRPCRRCVQMGRTSTCADVPHKRRGRPRLRDMQQLSASGSSLTTAGQLSPTRAGMPGSPSMRQRPLHSRTGSINSPYMESTSPQIGSSWSHGMQRRPGPPMGMSGHQRHMSMVPEFIPNVPYQSPGRVRVGSPEQYRSTSATLLAGIDLRIVRALPDVQNFFYASPAIIEGRNLAELVMGDDKHCIPQLIQALQEDIYANRLLFQAMDHRQSLSTDLLPYTNADLLHPFPGAKEHLLGLTFVDALNRPVVSRMVAVVGSRSNDRFAYVIINIQRQDYMPTPPTPQDAMSMASPRTYDSMYNGPGSPEFVRRHGPSSSVQISPSFVHRQAQAELGPPPNTLPRSVPEGYRGEPSRPQAPRQAPTGLGLNLLPPLQNIPEVDSATQTPRPARGRTPTPKGDSQRRSDDSQDPSKRTSMSLSEMLD